MKRRDFLKILSTAPIVGCGYTQPIPSLANTDKPDLYTFGKSTVEYENWPAEWGNNRITATGTYEAGDIVIGADGKKYRAIVTK